MPSPRTARTLGVTVTAAALAVGGLVGTAAADDNGVANLEAEQILLRSAAAFKTADSVHMEIDDEGGAMTGVEETDLSVDRQGNCTGEMKLPDDGGSFDFMVQADRTAWIKPDDKMLQTLTSDSGDASATAEASDLDDKWITRNLNRSEELESLKVLCNLGTLQTLASTQINDPVKGEQSEVDDTKVIAVKGRANGQEHTLYVATEGKPYPVKSESSDGKLSAHFSDFGELVTITPPSPDETGTL